MELKMDHWMKTLIYIKENPDTNITKLTIGLRSAIAHTSNICTILETKGLIQKEIKGRNTYLNLTPRGLLATNHIQELKIIIGGNQNE